MKATARQIEILNHSLSGFKWLYENHAAAVISAQVEIDGDVFPVERDYELVGDDGQIDGVLLVDFS